MQHILLIKDNTREESDLYYYYVSFKDACHKLASRDDNASFWEQEVVNEKKLKILLRKSPDKIFALYLRHFRDQDYSYTRETLPDDKYEAHKEVLLRQFISRMGHLEGVSIKEFQAFYGLMKRGFYEYLDYDIEKRREEDLRNEIKTS